MCIIHTDKVNDKITRNNTYNYVNTCNLQEH